MFELLNLIKYQQINLQLKNNHDDILYCLPNYHLTITIRIRNTLI